MHKLFSLPDALCEFIRALPAPDLPEAHQPETWPEDNTTSNGQTLADMCAPSAAWLAARDAYISHIMACPHCVTSGVKKPPHCAEGERLRQNYDRTR
ncbi:hypothetical protein AYO02_22000 [Escherichia coli]|uniref:hypothetical protein n=1 Tax=Escherichia coli TaxID=562 RepID=UPI0007DC3EDD|nr:hypothetical protein [Escherichia coli]OAR87168.1 hypothetical protein AYO02_22000 [Escherichia coli]